MNYRQALEYIDSLKGRGIVPGLDRIRELCRRIGNPQDQVRFVHVAGTNGKGSVTAYVLAVLTYAGYKTGCYNSPAVFDYRERIRVNGKNISQNAVAEGISLINKVCGEMKEDGWIEPTMFEVETALAFWYFWKKKCDIAVIETGMGGLNDATNLINTTITSVITTVSMDHMAFLGNSLQEIAAQKAGIIKPQIPVVMMKQQEEAQRVIEQKARDTGSRLVITDLAETTKVKYGIRKQSFHYKNWGKTEISLAGKYQIENAAAALDTIQVLRDCGLVIPTEAVKSGMLSAKWGGRFTVIAEKPLFIVDGAHNEDAAKKLTQSIEIYFTNKRILYIMGVLSDKEYEKMIALTSKYADQIITVTPPDNERALPAYELAREIAKFHPKVTCADSLLEGVEMAKLLAKPEDVILAFGSLSYLGKLEEVVRTKWHNTGRSAGRNRTEDRRK